MTPFNQKKASETFITTPPSQDYKIRIVGDVTPGFSGISRITTDDHGFRVTRPVDYKNKGDVYGIFAIGASTTAQMLLSSRKTWTTLLEKDLEKAWGRKSRSSTRVSMACAPSSTSLHSRIFFNTRRTLSFF